MENATLTISRALGLKAVITCFGLFVLFNCPKAYADVSGVFIDSSSDFVEMVQIIKTPDGRIVGRIESTTLNEEGGLETRDFTIEGAANSNQVILSAKSILLNGDTSLTGFVDGDLLDLSWPGGHRTYQRGDSYTYQSAVTGLQARAVQLIATLSGNKARAAHSELSEVLNKLRARTPKIQRQLDEAEEHYKKLYARVHNRRRASIALRNMDSMNGVARQADQEARQAETAIRRIDEDVRRLSADLRQDMKRADTLLASVQTNCAGAAEGGKRLCSDTASKEQELSSLSDGLQAAFGTLAATREQASIDTPPGQKLLKKIFD